MSTKRKLPQKLGQPVAKQGVKIVGKGALNESRTVVSNGFNSTPLQFNECDDVVNISSDSSSEDEDSLDGDSVAEDSAAEVDIVMQDAKPVDEDNMPEDDEKLGGPSFGDIISANAPEVIDVVDAIEDPDSRLTSYPKTRLQIPSGSSLGTVLAQALRTNDIALLETCLHTSDVNTIRATIQRLDSPLAAKLLHKLAERLHRRPGRAGNLIVWVQWTLVAHGGYLATQRVLMQSLAELTKVINGRSRGLQSVLSLKGKLDMLEAQIELRKSIQNYRRRFDDDDDDERVIYVEGQEDINDDAGNEPRRLAVNGNLEDISDERSEYSDDMPTVNGADIPDSEDDDEDDNSDNSGFIDDEAEESDEELEDENEVNHDDKDSIGDDEESDAAPPPKIARATKVFSRKR